MGGRRKFRQAEALRDMYDGHFRFKLLNNVLLRCEVIQRTVCTKIKGKTDGT